MTAIMIAIQKRDYIIDNVTLGTIEVPGPPHIFFFPSRNCASMGIVRAHFAQQDRILKFCVKRCRCKGTKLRCVYSSVAFELWVHRVSSVEGIVSYLASI